MDKPVQSTPLERSQSLLSQIDTDPNQCECALIGSRPLNGGQAEWLERRSRGIGFLDSTNLQFEHQHIRFEATGDNIGFMSGPELFSEDMDTRHYRYESECYDGNLMRKAISATGIPQAYQWLGYNCQEYVNSVKEKYTELKDWLAGK